MASSAGVSDNMKLTQFSKKLIRALLEVTLPETSPHGKSYRKGYGGHLSSRMHIGLKKNVFHVNAAATFCPQIGCP
jgi:hypothetical protein